MSVCAKRKIILGNKVLIHCSGGVWGAISCFSETRSHTIKKILHFLITWQGVSSGFLAKSSSGSCFPAV